ncbi:leucyl/phenylalanyl-tRNA--protein transferase [Paraglaciecola sp. MB-3u-78]|uniref:leucyl/phenylalanyl-tRNA--protein transferase n=1 Tax=Paraglaciecola sp. MB-3u-78 TaxID=2058332 RepID=UPI000C3370DA|nr:leucyl/phenylalanyl-tRNA--protein transferase [Paraglaciecola sp. MB-3u-78]PKG97544.1 leucyl/phenylalanyl-tRNA--protein transferase [Paraglaciecola sp. MB-3u-78]
MLTLTKLNQQLIFPPADIAQTDPNGLLAFGGDLSAKRLLLAYSSGIFPWFSQDEPIMWWSPDPRGILPLDNFKCSKSLKKFARNCDYHITINSAFDQVIDICAAIPRNDSGTWITNDMLNAYKKLHQLGHAHSVEVWSEDDLVGGLYGITVGKVFCGESMFHKATNASKLAMLSLVELLKSQAAEFIDCQMQNPHLASLGCIEVPRDKFLTMLQEQRLQLFDPDVWRPQTLNLTKWL